MIHESQYEVVKKDLIKLAVRWSLTCFVFFLIFAITETFLTSIALRLIPNYILIGLVISLTRFLISGAINAYYALIGRHYNPKVTSFLVICVFFFSSTIGKMLWLFWSSTIKTQPTNSFISVIVKILNGNLSFYELAIVFTVTLLMSLIISTTRKTAFFLFFAVFIKEIIHYSVTYLLWNSLLPEGIPISKFQIIVGVITGVILVSFFSTILCIIGEKLLYRFSRS